MHTGFWLVRHAIVEENARTMLYGAMDVGLCATSLAEQRPIYAGLAARLPQPAHWVVTPLSRTRRTAEAIFAAGYPAPLLPGQELPVEPNLSEQHFGTWQGLPYEELPALLTHPAHAFWPVASHEVPPEGESMDDVVVRVGTALERLATAHPGREVVAVSHGGAIRAAIAHAMGVKADPVLHISIANLSLTRLERVAEGWRVVCVNEMAGV